MYAMWTHGTSFFPMNAGPDWFRNKLVGDRPPLTELAWSDQQGFRHGREVEFRGRPNTRNFFTAPIPTPVIVEAGGTSIRTGLLRVMILGQTTSGAVVELVEVWDGGSRIRTFGGDGDQNLALAGDFRTLSPRNTFEFSTPPAVKFGLALSVRIAFGADDSSQPDNSNRAIFQGAGADLAVVRP